MKSALRLIGMLGVLLFGLGFALTFLSPIHYEKAARSFLEHKIEEKIKNRVDFGGSGKIAGFAKALAEKNRQQIDELKERFLPELRTRIAEVVARMQKPECECRLRLLQGLEMAGKLHISFLEKTEPQLRNLIEGQYGAIVNNLLEDLRIFTGGNLAAFTVMLLLSFIKPAFLRQLFIPGLMLAVASILASIIYIFGQNWFFALLYNDFVGIAYLVWLGLIYAFLCDIAVFKARTTSAIVEGIISSLPNALIPC